MFDVTTETSTGARLGAGPLTSVSRLTCEAALDRAGRVSFTMPATDADTALFPDNTARYVRGRAMRGGSRITVGRGIVRSRNLDSEARTMQLSGPDLCDELTRTIVGSTILESPTTPGTAMAAVSILPAVMAGALAGWTTTGTPSKEVYYKFGDESHLAALIKVAELTGDHFRLSISVDRRIEWLATTASGFDAAASGLRAIDTGDPDSLEDNDDVCLIVGGLSVETDDTQRITRIYPRGGGNADARLYLNATTRTAPAGYSLVVDGSRPDLSYIKYDVNDAAGQIGAVETFRDVAALTESSTADVSAADQLFDAALASLMRRITAQKAYRLRVTKVRRDLKVGETIHVVCKHFVDGYGWINVNAHLMMLVVAPTYEAGQGEPVYDLQVTA